MKKAEFSETQFFIDYCKELFNYTLECIIFTAPSTREEKARVSAMIIRYLSANGQYKYSEFYQFKRSKYYNKEVFNTPFDRNHKIIFNYVSQYLCSNPIEIRGFLGSEKEKYYSQINFDK